MKNFVYQDQEVSLTGRKAYRPLPGPGNKKSELVEIKPANEDDGTWTKWVPLATLFQIEEKDEK